MSTKGGTGTAMRLRGSRKTASLLMCAAIVVTANHYIVDLLIGFAYATASIFGVRWFWRRRGWPE